MDKTKQYISIYCIVFWEN